MNVKKFDEFKKLSDDIIAVSKKNDGSFEKIDEPINILQVTGIITDEEELKKIHEAFTLDTSLNVKDVKRGDILFLTALLERTSGSSINSQKLGVLKVRVVDYYIGLNKLNQIIPIKK
jgi:hypothetical protein